MLAFLQGTPFLWEFCLFTGTINFYIDFHFCFCFCSPFSNSFYLKKKNQKNKKRRKRKGKTKDSETWRNSVEQNPETCSATPTERAVHFPHLAHFSIQFTTFPIPVKRKQEVKEMAGEGDRVWEENTPVDQLDSDSKPTKTVQLKRGRGRPSRKTQVVEYVEQGERGKGENAGKNEELLLNEGLHQPPDMSMELRNRPSGQSSEEEDFRQHKTQLPITLSEVVNVLNYTSSLCVFRSKIAERRFQMCTEYPYDLRDLIHLSAWIRFFGNFGLCFC